MQIPAINIGNRQRGREKSDNVIDVVNDTELIIQSIQKALFDKDFITEVKKISNPYGNGNSAIKIVNILKTISLDNVINKQFVD